MLLAIDIGNSYITIGAFDGDELLFVTELVSDKKLSVDQYAVSIKNVISLYCDDICVEGAVISSVVPELSGTVKSAVCKLFSVKALIVGPGVKTGLHIDIENPAQLGANIAACAVSAIESMPLPCIICEFGTATTLSVIDAEAKLTGVVICPGVYTALTSLTEKTALLPGISIEKPKSVIGKNTIHSMQSGFVYGFAAMLDGVIDRINEELGTDANIVCTGFKSKDISSLCKHSMKTDTKLLLKGLNKIYKRNIRNEKI